MLHFFVTSPAAIVGENYEHFQAFVRMLGKVLNKKFMEDAVYEKFVSILREARATENLRAAIDAAYNELDKKHQTNLENALNE